MQVQQYRLAYKQKSLSALSLAALGIVFGDIGTSPLYTFKTLLILTDYDHSSSTLLGLLSLLFWSLIIVVSIKYVFFAMRITNKGEGGILALMSMLGLKTHHRPLVVVVGLFGAALLYGDGAITPAISVLSALEGLTIAFPTLQRYILPATVITLLLLFLLQPLGTRVIGKTFGPIMVCWFISLGLLGIYGISHYPAVIAAINPGFGIQFLLNNGYLSLVILGGVFLCVTGAEALYADMGHFSPFPIRLMWYGLVFPCLLLNYAGQAALALAGANIADNIFYRLCPPLLLLPLVILSTLATIIASQAIITGAFSLTRQAIQLGWLPRLHIKQTSALGYGQIYIGVVNLLLMLATIGLVLWFKSSDNLAAAYGMAVSLTMFLTTILLFIAMRDIWRWPKWARWLVAGSLLVVDAGFVLANLTKFSSGGYLPLCLALILFMVMFIWHHGSRLLALRVEEQPLASVNFLQNIADNAVQRVPGLGIFLNRLPHGIPPVMDWHVKRNHALHQNLINLHVNLTDTPWVQASQRIQIAQITSHFWQITVNYGFMEQVDIPTLLKQQTYWRRLQLDFANATYYIGREVVIRAEQNRALSPWQYGLFAFLFRNAAHSNEALSLPSDQVVEIGRQVAL